MKDTNKDMGKGNSGKYLVYGILVVVAIVLFFTIIQPQGKDLPIEPSDSLKSIVEYNCEKSGDNKITCEWSECYGNSVVALQKGELTYSWILDNPSGKHDFDDLDSGNYMVVFVCGNQTRILESIYIKDKLKL